MPVDIETITGLLLKARESSLVCIKPVLKKHDLTEQQWRVIRELHKHGDLNAQKLARESGILSPSLSRILARFTEVGVVVRKVNKDDQRAQNIRLSAKGKRIHSKIHPQVEKQYKAMAKAVGDDKFTKLQVLLRHVSDSLTS